MKRISFITCLVYSFLNHSVASTKGIREVETNDHLMKSINLTMGRSTILSFADKPVKVVTGNSNYFNIEYIGNDLTIQPLANVETNLFVYTESKTKYGFHLKVGPVFNYDDMVYVRWKKPDTIEIQTHIPTERQQKILKPIDLKAGLLVIRVNKFLRLKGTRTYLLDFEVNNKDVHEVLLNSLEVFASRNSERLKGQKLFFDTQKLRIHGLCRGRLFLSIPEDKDFALYLHYQKKLQKVIISKVYL